MNSYSESMRIAPQSARRITMQERFSQVVFWLISGMWRATTENAHALISRYTGHLVILALAIGAVMLSGALPNLGHSAIGRPDLPVVFAASGSNQVMPTPATPLGLRPALSLSSRGLCAGAPQQCSRLIMTRMIICVLPSNMRL